VVAGVALLPHLDLGGGIVSDYQVLPPLSDDEYVALRDAIAEQGYDAAHPIVVDEAGDILDGHHRMRACRELGVSPATVTRAGLTHEQKIEYALAANLRRRHLSQQQKRELIRAELERDPARSDRAIGRLLGVSHPTVAAVRREVEGRQVVNPSTPAGDPWGFGSLEEINAQRAANGAEPFDQATYTELQGLWAQAMGALEELEEAGVPPERLGWRRASYDEARAQAEEAFALTIPNEIAEAAELLGGMAARAKQLKVLRERLQAALDAGEVPEDEQDDLHALIEQATEHIESVREMFEDEP
jgi:hypothetical protein